MSLIFFRRALCRVLLIGAVAGCASGPSNVPVAPRSPVSSAESLALNGAKFPRRFEFKVGGFSVHTFTIRGGQIEYTFYWTNGEGQEREHTDSYEITGGMFYMPSGRDYCYSVVSTPDCGLRGTITPEGIFFTRMADDRPSEKQYSTYGESLRPAYRSK
jgi:hypothetical protein